MIRHKVRITSWVNGAMLGDDATITYGAALMAAAFTGIVGVGSPGLEGVLLNLVLGALILLAGSRRPWWELGLCLLALQLGVIAPKRLISIGIRELSGVSFHLGTIANMLAAFWMTAGAANVIRELFKKTKGDH